MPCSSLEKDLLGYHLVPDPLAYKGHWEHGCCCPGHGERRTSICVGHSSPGADGNPSVVFHSMTAMCCMVMDCTPFPSPVRREMVLVCLERRGNGCFVSWCTISHHCAGCLLRVYLWPVCLTLPRAPDPSALRSLCCRLRGRACPRQGAQGDCVLGVPGIC